MLFDALTAAQRIGDYKAAAAIMDAIMAFMKGQPAMVPRHVLPATWDIQPQALPAHEGLVPGEVIAWRAWRIVGHRLVSCAVDECWSPENPMKGDPSNPERGVHAFKSLSGVLNYSGKGQKPIAIGKVALWGEIHEHELGYRAEFAKVWELCEVMQPTNRETHYIVMLDQTQLRSQSSSDQQLLASLRQTYKVGDRK